MMVLVDTSVWVGHFRSGDTRLVALLNGNQVLTHPMVIGELACGNLRNRSDTLTRLKDLPKAFVASDEVALSFIERHKLMGRGIGYIDAHLLVSTALDASSLWTLDNRLMSVAMDLHIAYLP